METIGSKISEIRKQKGLSQEELSDNANINLRTLQRIEKGINQPRGNTLKNICTVLEINIENLLDYNKKKDLKFLQYFHLSVLACIFFPLGSIILPMVLWLTKRDKIIDLNEQGVNLLNFQILWNLIFYSSFILWFLLKINHWSNSNLLFYVMGVLYVINIFYAIIVSILIGKGKLKMYYLNIFPFIKM
ncbi:DUF4870 domain-containing protein [Saccharicrinis sp. FJH62]|uniref:DUF4870 domain-containing protein n=1 Tax=Saccharicrinis sp. FJH62 TaxID=3344657 RepID=UPI0035D4C906